MGLYALPNVGRSGLGNMLFPWARAELFAQRAGARVLAPHWAKLRVGPYRRREPDKRNYSGLFRAEQHVRGTLRLVIASFGHRISERHLERVPRDANDSTWPCVVEFKGLDGLFAPLTDHSDFIRRRLWDMTREQMRSKGEQYGEVFVGMHLRRGDITRIGYSEERLRAEVTQYTPISWFASMARALRVHEKLDRVPIVVFTDGSDEEIAALSGLEGVIVHRRRPAIADLWTLAHAKLLFASGYSTFSMWASFLGGMPTVYAPGKIQQRVQRCSSRSVEIELPAGERIPPQALTGLLRGC